MEALAHPPSCDVGPPAPEHCVLQVLLALVYVGPLAYQTVVRMCMPRCSRRRPGTESRAPVSYIAPIDGCTGRRREGSVVLYAYTAGMEGLINRIQVCVSICCHC